MRVRNWAHFQHYKQRRPPWIKLHRALLDDYAFLRLPLAAQALAPRLWLLASESQDGSISDDVEELAFRMRVSPIDMAAAVKSLLESGFLEQEENASEALAEGLRVVSPEESRVEERQSSEAEDRDTTDLPNDARPPVGSRLGRGLGALLSDTVKAGLPGELEKARAEYHALLLEGVDVLRLPYDELLAKTSRTPSGSVITNLAGCMRLDWMRTSLERLRGMVLVAKADRPGARQPAPPDLLAAWLSEQGDALPERIAAHLAERRAELEAVRDPVDRAAARVEMIRAWARAEGAPNGGAGVVECIGPAIREAQRERETA